MDAISQVEMINRSSAIHSLNSNTADNHWPLRALSICPPQYFAEMTTTPNLPVTSAYGGQNQTIRELTAAKPIRVHANSESNADQVKIALERADLWNEFHHHVTEMIITKSGRRMFPTLQFRVSGLDPVATYGFYVVFAPADNNRYKFQGGKWSANGQAETPVPISLATYHHPDSPAPGHLWMSQPVSFHRIKLTNCSKMPMDMVLLNSMHKYQPHLFIVKLRNGCNGQFVAQFEPPETRFIAVTAYQNNAVTNLKVKHNPFAKGFRQTAIDFRASGTDHNAQDDQSVSSNTKRKFNDSETQRASSAKLPRPDQSKFRQEHPSKLSQSLSSSLGSPLSTPQLPFVQPMQLAPFGYVASQMTRFAVTTNNDHQRIPYPPVIPMIQRPFLYRPFPVQAFGGVAPIPNFPLVDPKWTNFSPGPNCDVRFSMY